MKRLAWLLPLSLLLVVSCNGRSPTDPAGGWATLSGVVSNPYGSVWGGVSVGLVDANGSVVGSARTDQSGRYSLTMRSPGRYRVWLQLGPTGPGSFVADIELHAGNNTLDIVSS